MATVAPAVLTQTDQALKPEEIRAQFMLPSGKQVVLRKGKGRDARLALMAAGPKADMHRIILAMLAQLAVIDGKRVPLEAIDDFDFDDVVELLARGMAAMGPLVKGTDLEAEKAGSADESSS
jgi:hypothetical protein